MKGLGKFVTEFMSTDGAVPPTEADWAAALLTDKPPALTVDADATINPAADDEQPARPATTESPEYACARLKLIHEDIAAAKKNLANLPDAFRRGLTIDTLREFGCGYLATWTSTKSRIKGSHPTPTPRLIIPTPNHYLARLTVPLENFPEAQREYVRLKPHEGAKDTFGLYDALNQISRNPNLFLTITEGEIDAMSIWQSVSVPVVATSGADSWKRTLTNLATRDEYAGNFKLRVLILFDPDDTGRKAAPQFRAALMDAGIPAVVKFLSPEVCKIDANQILCERGEAALREIFKTLTKNIDEEFADAESEIAAFKESPTTDEAGESDFARAHNLEQGIKSCVSGSGYQRDYDNEPPALVQDKILAMLNWIDPRSLPRNQWLAVMTACKNLGVAYDIVNTFNLRDPDRYDERSNLATWNGLTEHYGIEVLAARARDFGFDFKDFYRQWYREHPEYSKRKPYRNNRPVAREHSAADDAAANKSRADDPDVIRLLFDLPFDDVGNARRLALLFGDRVRFELTTRRWLIYEDGVWKFGSGAADSLYPLAITVKEILAARQPQDGADGRGESIEKGISRWGKIRTISAAVETLKGVPAILTSTEKLNSNPALLNVANGTIDFSTGEFYSHRAKDLLTFKAPVVYNPDASSELFDNFMEGILPDEKTRRAVLRFLGYALTGDVRCDKALFIYGDGRNGKGSLFRVIQGILGDYCTSLSNETFMKRKTSRDPNEATPEINKLVGRHCALTDELPQNGKVDEARFKHLTGGDAFAFRLLHCEGAVNSRPTHKLIFSGNYLPRISDPYNDGLQARFLIAHFPKKFVGEDCDPTLRYRLTEPKNLSGALNVLMREAVAFYREGLLESPAMVNEKKAFLSENDWLSEFISEHCILAPDKIVSRAELLARLKSEAPAARNFSDRALTDMLKKIDGVNYGRGVNGGGSGARQFKGIGILG